MGEQTDPVVYDLSDGSPSLGQQPEDHARVYSEATAQRLDTEVERLTKSAVLADCQRRTAVAFCLESGEFLVGDFIKNELAVEIIKQSAS